MKTCTKCGNDTPDIEMAWRDKSKEILSSWCKRCQAETKRAAYKKPEVAQQARMYQLRRKYGVGIDSQMQMLSNQQGRCPVCLKPFENLSQVRVDHDHANGKVRALLCHPCNIGLGWFKDNPEVLDNAAAFLRIHQEESGTKCLTVP